MSALPPKADIDSAIEMSAKGLHSYSGSVDAGLGRLDELRVGEKSSRCDADLCFMICEKAIEATRRMLLERCKNARRAGYDQFT
jgi:hypothetical protein